MTTTRVPDVALDRADRFLHRRVRIARRPSRPRPSATASPKRMTPPTPSALAAAASRTASSTDSWKTPGIERPGGARPPLADEQRIDETAPARVSSRARARGAPASGAAASAGGSGRAARGASRHAESSCRCAAPGPPRPRRLPSKIVDQRLRPAPEWCRVAGITVVSMPSCCAASAVTGPIDATTVVRSRSAAGSSPSIFTKFRTVDALVNVIASTCRSSSIR